MSDGRRDFEVTEREEQKRTVPTAEELAEMRELERSRAFLNSYGAQRRLRFLSQFSGWLLDKAEEAEKAGKVG